MDEQTTDKAVGEESDATGGFVSGEGVVEHIARDRRSFTADDHPQMTAINCRLPQRHLDHFKAVCEAQGVSMTKKIRQLLPYWAVTPALSDVTRGNFIEYFRRKARYIPFKFEWIGILATRFHFVFKNMTTSDYNAPRADFPTPPSIWSGDETTTLLVRLNEDEASILDNYVSAYNNTRSGILARIIADVDFIPILPEPVWKAFEKLVLPQFHLKTLKRDLYELLQRSYTRLCSGTSVWRKPRPPEPEPPKELTTEGRVSNLETQLSELTSIVKEVINHERNSATPDAS